MVAARFCTIPKTVCTETERLVNSVAVVAIGLLGWIAIVGGRVSTASSAFELVVEPYGFVTKTE